MMTDSHKKIAAGAVILIAVTWWLATAPESPVRPKPERPVLKFLAKVAKVAARWGLTALVFMEPSPPDVDETQIKHAAAGEDGYAILRNERW